MNPGRARADRRVELYEPSTEGDDAREHGPVDAEALGDAPVSEAGHRRPKRTASVLDPSFCGRLDELATDEVRTRRDLALAERDYQSYLRRLIQARQDLLEQERARRQAGREPDALVDRLISVLSTGPQGGSRGEALRLQVPAEDIAAAEAEMRSLLGEADLAEPDAMEDQDLQVALEALRAAERRVSEDRSAVFGVHDRLQEELKRRYRQDPSEIGSRL
jgi:hypothetical protein